MIVSSIYYYGEGLMMSGTNQTRFFQYKVVWGIIGLAYIVVWILPFIGNFSGQANGSAESLAVLRDYSRYQWYVIALFGLVSFAYAKEVEKKNWSAVFAGLTFVFVNLFNELWNGLIFTFTGGYSAYWMLGYPSAYNPLIGWCVEIICCFLLFGLVITKGIPEDKNKKFFGFLNNRIVIAFAWATTAVVLEMILNSFGALIWNYWWWSTRFPFFLLILAYFPFALAAYFVYDMNDTKKQAWFTGILGGTLTVAYVVLTLTGLV